MDRSVTSGVFGAILMLSAIMFGRVGEASASEKPIAKRIADRASPSIFEAWNSADNLNENPLVTAARHDLIFNGAGFFGLQWNNVHQGLGTDFTEASIRQGRLRRHDLLSRNPNIVLIMEIRYRDASKAYLPDGHKWWRRDGDAKIVSGWEEGQYLQLDFSNPEYRAQVAIQAQAALESGVVDGIMLDWWRDDDDRLSLVQSIRNRIGETALVLVNANDRTTPKTAPHYQRTFYGMLPQPDAGGLAAHCEHLDLGREKSAPPSDQLLGNMVASIACRRIPHARHHHTFPGAVRWLFSFCRP